jgi:hypothetical protein
MSGNARSAAWLRGLQNSDGGWGFAAGAASDADTTGAVLQGLAASGNHAGIRRGVSYLRGAQRPGGGFPLNNGAVNAQSTAYAVQGLIAAGVSPSAVRRGGHSPLDYLASVQARDGHYRYSASSDPTPVWVTGQALLAVNGAAFPLSPVPRRSTATGGSAGGSGAGSGPGAAQKQPAKPGKESGTQPSGTTTSEPTATVPLSPAAAHAGGGDDGGGIPGWLIVVAAIALVSAGVWAGWVLYSRRLPG